MSVVVHPVTIEEVDMCKVMAFCHNPNCTFCAMFDVPETQSYAALESQIIGLHHEAVIGKGHHRS